MSEESLVISTFVCRHHLRQPILLGVVSELLSIAVAASDLLVISVLSVGTDITLVVNGIETVNGAVMPRPVSRN